MKRIDTPFRIHHFWIGVAVLVLTFVAFFEQKSWWIRGIDIFALVWLMDDWLVHRFDWKYSPFFTAQRWLCKLKACRKIYSRLGGKCE